MLKKDICPSSERNLRECSCTYDDCPRHGICCECVRYHRQKSQIPACFFSAEDERTYNRSVEFFVRRQDR